MRSASRSVNVDDATTLSVAFPRSSWRNWNLKTPAKTSPCMFNAVSEISAPLRPTIISWTQRPRTGPSSVNGRPQAAHAWPSMRA